MREISEAETWALVSDAECPVLGKEESQEHKNGVGA